MRKLAVFILYLHIFIVKFLRFLDAIVQDNREIRPQDYATAFGSAVNSNEENTMIVFAYIQRNLADVRKA